MFNFLNSKLTKNYTEVPLFWVDFNLEKYEKYGAENSCMVKVHPMLKDDEYVKQGINDLINYIRCNFNMDELSK